MRKSGAVFRAEYRGEFDYACGYSPVPEQLQQYGTQHCAEQGYGWMDILRFYYTGLEFVVAGFGPSTAAYTAGDRIDIVTRGTDNNVYLKTWTPSGWTGFSSIGAPPSGAGSEPTAVWWKGNTRLDIFVRGGDGQLWDRYMVGGGTWSTWGSLGGVLASGPKATAFTTGDRIDVFYRGADNTVTQVFSSDGVSWQVANLGGDIISAPAAAWWQSDGRLDLIVRWSDDTLRQNYWTASTAWSGWIVPSTPGATLTAGPALAAMHFTTRSTDRLDVVHRGGGNDLYDSYWDPVSGWHAWNSAGGTVASTPTAVWWESDADLDLFARSMNNHLVQKRLTTAGWWNLDWFDLGAMP
jgi:hypothetical protein